MSLDRIALLVVDAAGVPKTNATPKFSLYRASGVDRTPPTGSLATAIPHLGGGLYGCTASADDVSAGTAYVIDAGAGAFVASGGTRGFGSVNPANAPLFAQLFEDGAGALWAGAAPTLGIWNDFAAVPSTPPAVFPIVAPYFFGFRPSSADLLAGRVFRWDAPAGAYPQYPHGVAFYGSGAPSDSLGAAIIAELAADPDITALIGTRMYPNVLPQGVTDMPALVYNIISTTPENTLAGAAAETFRTVRLQIDCWAKKYLDAHTLDELVDQVIANLARPDLSAWRESSRDLYDNPTQRHRVQTDYMVQR